MNDFQIGYTLALLALAYPAWKRQRYAFCGLLANLVATLLACLAMDLGALDRTGATMTMLIIDLATGVALAMKPGTAQLLAWGYAVTVPIYFANLLLGVQIGATFAIVYVVAVAQLGVLGIGTLGGNSGGGGRRYPARGVSLAVQARGGGLHPSAISRDVAEDIG